MVQAQALATLVLDERAVREEVPTEMLVALVGVSVGELDDLRAIGLASSTRCSATSACASATIARFTR